jgi:hypothetical protein
MLSDFFVCFLYSNQFSKTAIWKSSPSIAASDITSRFQTLTAAADRQVVSGQKSLAVCTSFFFLFKNAHSQHTQSTGSRISLCAVWAITCSSRLKKAQVFLRSVSLPMRDLDHYRLRTCVGSIELSVTGWWTGINFFVRLAAITTERVLRPSPWCICTLRAAILSSFNCRSYMGI